VRGQDPRGTASIESGLSEAESNSRSVHCRSPGRDLAMSGDWATRAKCGAGVPECQAASLSPPIGHPCDELCGGTDTSGVQDDPRFLSAFLCRWRSRRICSHHYSVKLSSVAFPSLAGLLCVDECSARGQHWHCCGHDETRPAPAPVPLQALRQGVQAQRALRPPRAHPHQREALCLPPLQEGLLAKVGRRASVGRPSANRGRPGTSSRDTSEHCTPIPAQPGM
jgi:hypothetical protein